MERISEHCLPEVAPLQVYHFKNVCKVASWERWLRLQGHCLARLVLPNFCASLYILCTQRARTLNDIPAVLGFETLNEPHPGWLGRQLRRGSKRSKQISCQWTALLLATVLAISGSTRLLFFSVQTKFFDEELMI